MTTEVKGKDAAPKDSQQPADNAAGNAATDAVDNATTNGVAEEDPDLPRRIYVGNLSFQTQEEELKESFSKFGTIKSVTIGRRHNRHMGFGFVVYEDEASATKAISEMHKSTLQERVLSVQSARPKAEGKTRRQARKKALAAKRKKAEATKSKEAEGAEASGDTSDVKEEEKKPRRPAKKNTEKPKKPRGPPSTNTVFVGNVAFSLTDEEFSKAFSDAGLDVKSAYIVQGRGRWAKRSKGFGFVELADEAQQKKCVELMHGKQLGDRTISVRIALEKVTNGDAEGGSDENQANGEVEVKTEIKTEPTD